jgi:outer membrane murein-binding lipoprotein Lpp
VWVRPLVLCALLVAGCKSNTKYDLIEAELRTRERELADTRAALDRSRNLLHAYEAAQPPPVQPVGSGPHPSGPFVAVKEIALGRGTGGLDEDGAPGDEGLMVVIVPKDEDGSAVKVPGRALIAAWEVTPAGLKNPIGSWEISSDRLRRTWKGGFISTGYFVPVPWQTPPAFDHVRVGVRLVTTDGRAYEADRDVSVKPPLPPRGHVGPPPQPAPGVTPGPGVPTIPAPPGTGRRPLFPDMPPPGVPSAVPPGTEELPAPAPVERGARLLPPVKP